MGYDYNDFKTDLKDYLTLNFRDESKTAQPNSPQNQIGPFKAVFTPHNALQALKLASYVIFFPLGAAALINHAIKGNRTDSQQDQTIADVANQTLDPHKSKAPPPDTSNPTSTGTSSPNLTPIQGTWNSKIAEDEVLLITDKELQLGKVRNEVRNNLSSYPQMKEVETLLQDTNVKKLMQEAKENFPEDKEGRIAYIAKLVPKLPRYQEGNALNADVINMLLLELNISAFDIAQLNREGLTLLEKEIVLHMEAALPNLLEIPLLGSGK